MTTSVIVAGARTPVGRLSGSLKGLSGSDLGGVAIKGALEKAGVAPELVEYVVMGQVLTAGAGQIPARQAAVAAGIPMDVPALTINKVCLSGINAIALADQMIRAGEFDVVVAGGQESMTQAPHLLEKSRAGFKYGDVTMHDHLAFDGLYDIFTDQAMGGLTECRNEGATASTREEQDAFAAESHQRAAAAWKNGVFDDEVVPVSIPQRKGDPIVFDRDEHPRPGTTIEALTKLRPINGPDLTVTAGNASGVNDGAAAMLMASEAAASQHGLTPIARVVGISAAGVEPRVMGIGPVPASQKVLARAGLTIDQMDVIELNEAFASQGIATLRALGVADDAPHVNANGGAIAIGHPLGMSGARLVMTAALQLKRTGGRYALCTMCVGVGQGVAIILERA